MNKVAMMTFFALLIGPFLAEQAGACCAYNNTTIPVKTHLDCKEHWYSPCSNDWDIAPHDRACHPSKGGGLDVCDTFHVAHSSCYFIMDEHGWISMYEETSRYKLVNHANDGSVKDVSYVEK